MTCVFPAVGQRTRADFIAFPVELEFASHTSLTYYNVNSNGKIVGSETVTTRVEPITDQIFLVTWQESDKTAVVHVEDYQKRTIVTNITNPPDLTFGRHHGAFKQLS